LSSRIGRIFWYSGELYQRFTASLSANSRMTMRLGSSPPSTSSVAPPLDGLALIGWNFGSADRSTGDGGQEPAGHGQAYKWHAVRHCDKHSRNKG
jgi:hypothetical protein